MSNNTTKPNLYFDNVEVKETEVQKYRGVTLDGRLTFKFHVNDIVDEAKRRLKVLKRLTGTEWVTSKDYLIRSI